MANKGLRFFGTDYCEGSLGGTETASSNISFAQFAFDGLIGTKWTSSGEDTDGDLVELEMDFGINRSIDSIFIEDTNIDDIELQYWDGYSYQRLDGYEDENMYDSFEDWPSGDTLAPAAWTLSGTGAAVEKESTIKKVGNFSAKITRNGTDAYLKRNVYTEKGVTYWQGKTVIFGCWVYATEAGRAKLDISDGIGTTYSAAHSGGSGWEFLTVSKTISGSATFVRCECLVFTGDTSAYFDGAVFLEASSIPASTLGTIQKNSDGSNVFLKRDSAVTTQKVRIQGRNTITADQEKYVRLFHAFTQIGQFEYFPGFAPKFTPIQNVFNTMDGRGFVIERGEKFSAKIDFKSHTSQDDIDIAETLLARKEPFFIWPNGGDEDIFRFSFKPYRFQDLFKVTIVGDSTPELTKNYYKGGYNNTINLIEVV